LELQDVQDAGDIAAAANQPTQRRYMSDVEIIGLDLIGKPTAAPVYRQIWLPNYTGPDFRSAIEIVDAAINRPLVLSADKVVVDPFAVLQPPPSTPEGLWRPTDGCILAGSPSRPSRLRWWSAKNVALPSELEQGTVDSICTADETRLAETPVQLPELNKSRRLWRRIKRFVRWMYCCRV